MRLGHRHIPLLASIALFAAAYAFGALRYEHFATVEILRNLLVDNAFLAVAAIGATFVILMGGIDLSVGSVMACTSILVASLTEQQGWHPVPAFLLALLLATAFGAAQGTLIHVFQLPPFLITLAGLFLARGIAFWIHPQSLAINHPFVANTLNDSLSLTLPVGERGVSIPITVPVVLATLAAAWFILSSTRAGRAIYAIGDDEQSALLMGLPVARIRIGTYALSGFLAALAGILFLLYQQSGDPAACRGFELDAIAAVVIGGTLLQGGVGSVLGTAVGVGILGLIQTLITFQGDLNSWWTRIIVGLLVLVFVSLQRVLRSAAARLPAGGTAPR